MESRVLSADPIELVRMLYQGAIEAIEDARRHLAESRIAERSQAISRACCILIELNGALDHSKGGEIAGRLASLYDYMQRRLLDANIHQADAPLAEVSNLLTTIAEGWAGVANPVRSEEPVGNAWAAPTLNPAACYAPAAWSL